MRDRYSRDELARLFRDARPEPPSYTSEEARAAGEAAGISAEAFEASAQRLELDHKKRRNLQLGAGVVVVVFATIVFGPSIAGAPIDTLPIHNEHARYAFEVEVLVPTSPREDCARSPGASAYCVLHKQLLRPSDRTRIKLPDGLGACPQVWVRTSFNGEPWRSNIFELPASVEIERDGSLDQKGLGAPNLFGAPIGDASFAPPSCGGGA